MHPTIIEKHLKLVPIEATICSTPLSAQLKTTHVQLFQATDQTKGEDRRMTLQQQIESLQFHCKKEIQVITCPCNHFDIVKHIASEPSLYQKVWAFMEKTPVLD